MQEALSLLGDVEERDRAWLLDHGAERQLLAQETVIREGTVPDGLFIVLEGLLEVQLSIMSGRRLATLGPGELLGEISFVEARPASASVRTLENSRLLEIPYSALEKHSSEDPRFAATLYRSFARILSARLRRRVAALGEHSRDPEKMHATTLPAWARLSGTFAEFKALMKRADHEALTHDGKVTEEVHEIAQAGFLQLVEQLNTEIGDGSPLDRHVREELGARAQQEFLPFLLLTRVSERTYSKPRGYAGDYQTIEWLYDGRPGGSGRLGPLIDGLGLKLSAVKAVRNRRPLLAEEIRRTLASANGGAVELVSLACGPASELFDVFAELDDASRLRASLVDIDPQALEFVKEKRDARNLGERIDLIQGNLVYMATGRQRIDLAEQDLVYSIGLIDYFNDKFVLALINWIHGILRPGGRTILGNFHPSNPDKAFMDHVLEWKLIHRTEDEMNRLFAASKFGRHCTKIRFEPQGINLFAECVKT